MAPKLVTFAAGLALVAAFARAPTDARDEAGRPLLPSAKVLQHVGKAQLPLVVTLYWLRVINLGATARNEVEGLDVLAMSELIETLDPAFSQVYWFAALNGVVPSTTERGKWANAEEGAQHLRRGLEHHPDEARMTIVLAFNLWKYQNKLVEAAEVLRAGAKYPGAPRYLAPLATRLLVAAGDFEASKQLAREFLEGSVDPQTRAVFARREKMIELEEILVKIEAAATRFSAERGRPAMSVVELFAAGYLPELPADPFGGVLALDPDGTAYSTMQGERMKIYERTE